MEGREGPCTERGKERGSIVVCVFREDIFCGYRQVIIVRRNSVERLVFF